LAAAGAANAAPVTLQTGTATFSQLLPACSSHSPDLAVNGNLFDNGWAIATFCSPGDSTSPQAAVWETAVDVDATTLLFALHQNFGSQHLIGRFRLSVTSDNRSDFADGLDNGGDVTANWVVLTSPVISGPGGLTLAVQPDGSILAGGSVPNTGTYTLTYTGAFLGVTGIRLEVLADPSLPFNGPGLQPTNGNFVLSELQLDASGTPSAPEPGTGALALLGLATLLLARRRASDRKPHCPAAFSAS
jgi:MYXO-CTERM domain-containing protein